MADMHNHNPIPRPDPLPALDMLLLARVDINLSVIPAGL